MKRVAVSLALVLAVASPAFAKGSGNSSKGAGAKPPSTAQPSKDDDAVAYMNGLMTTRQTQSDEEALASIKQLVKYGQDSELKDETKALIPQLLDWYAKHYDEKKKPTICVAALKALGDLGPGKSVQRLVQVLDSLLLQKAPAPDEVSAAFEALKTAADPAVTGVLFKMIVEKDATTAGKALDAFLGYAASPPELRKRIFDELLTDSESMAAVAAKGADKTAVDKWTALAPSALAVLSTLSRQQFADVSEARKWADANGKKPDAFKDKDAPKK